MSTEKALAIVVRQADFSESSRVITFFSKEFGKFSALAKGAKRLKGPFDAALDLLSECRIVFIRKTSGALSLLTEARLQTRFRPGAHDLSSLYGGYYIAELVNSLTEDFDPHPRLYDLAVASLEQLSLGQVPSSSVIVQFEIGILQDIGVFPNLDECSVCGESVVFTGRFAHWVSQGGLLCQACRREEYAAKSVAAETVQTLRRLADHSWDVAGPEVLTAGQAADCHRLTVSSITHVLGRRPATLRYLMF
ncbi:MAG: DNA repair protein RecO [Planctomycetaceae bacterium]|nr:DNA repair protein RecO [Planctomycetaceae bacterium]